MSSKSPAKIIWGVLWAVILIASYFSFQKADRYFSDYISSFGSSQRNICELLPANISAFVCDQNFPKDLNQFRSSSFYPAFKNISSVREMLSAWNLDENESSAWEKWVGELWGPSVVAGYSRENETVYLLAPVGNGDQCFDWLKKALSMLHHQNISWTTKQIGKRVCIESQGSTFWPAGMQVQFYSLHGIGVLAMGTNPNPIQPIYEAADAPQNSLYRNPEFPRFYEEGIHRESSKDQRVKFGFIRQKNAENSINLGKTWSMTLQEKGGIDFECAFPTTNESDTEDAQKIFSSFAKLQQSDDLLSVESSWKELKKLTEQGSSYIPSTFTDSINALTLPAVLGSYSEVWEPVFGKIGDEFFLSFGEAGMISDRYRIPFPRTVLAVPFHDKAAFFRALETTLTRANEEMESNLLIRKSVGAYGEYYEIKMARSEWRELHGLKELPLFAVTDDFLILASNSGAMERVLQKFNSTSSEDVKKSEEQVFEMHINMKEAPSILRVLFGAFGMLNPQGENVFLSPRAMSLFSETFSLMQNFEAGDLTLIRKPNQTQIKIRLN